MSRQHFNQILLRRHLRSGLCTDKWCPHTKENGHRASVACQLRVVLVQMCGTNSDRRFVDVPSKKKKKMLGVIKFCGTKGSISARHFIRCSPLQKKMVEGE